MIKFNRTFDYTIEEAENVLREQLNSASPDIDTVDRVVVDLHERLELHYIMDRPDMEGDVIATAQRAAVLLEQNRQRLDEIGILVDEKLEVRDPAHAA